MSAAPRSHRPWSGFCAHLPCCHCTSAQNTAANTTAWQPLCKTPHCFLGMKSRSVSCLNLQNHIDGNFTSRVRLALQSGYQRTRGQNILYTTGILSTINLGLQKSVLINTAGISTYDLKKRSGNTANTGKWLKQDFNNTFFYVNNNVNICFNKLHCPEGTEKAKGSVFEDWSSGLSYHMSRPFCYYPRNIKESLHKAPSWLVRAHWKDLTKLKNQAFNFFCWS